MAGLLTKGIKLSYSTSGTTSYTQIPDLMECPALGGSREKVDITTLADGAYKYIAGLKTQEDLAFKFLYDKCYKFLIDTDNLILLNDFISLKFNLKAASASSASFLVLKPRLQY